MAQQQFCSSAKLLLPRISVPASTRKLLFIAVTRNVLSVSVKAAFCLRPTVPDFLLGHGAMRSAVFPGRLRRRTCQLFLQAAALRLDSFAVYVSAKLLEPRANHLRSVFPSLLQLFPFVIDVVDVRSCAPST